MDLADDYMPIIPANSYKSPVYLFNGHLQTIIPNLFRKIPDLRYTRERIDTPDGDFLDLDWSVTGSDRLVIISHGLEGNTDRQYVRGMVRAFNRAGWDAMGWNCRSCSGEMNRLARFYHHADTIDLQTVIAYVAENYHYQSIGLIGFSMGGSMLLRLLGERGGQLAPLVRGAVAFSVPCDLMSSALHLSKPRNRMYARRFIRKLERKIKAKAELLPNQVTYTNFHQIRVFKDFDDRYTAPLHGFRNAEDFYAQASVHKYLPGIRIPTLLINAINDPFLTPECFPVEEAEANPYLFLEMPRQGGHVGFSVTGRAEYWSEKRAVDFIRECPLLQTDT
jgi:uncharacterized protein